MGWELQNISTASFSFKWEFSVADDVVLRGTGSQTANYDNLTWFMIAEKCRRQNDMLSYGLLGLVIDGSPLQTWRSPGATGQGKESQCFTQRKDPLPWLLPDLSPEKITPMDWRGHPSWANSFWTILQTGRVMELTIRVKGRDSRAHAGLILGLKTTLKYSIIIPIKMRLYYWEV